MRTNRVDQSIDIGWSFDTIQAFRYTLLEWYDQNKRDLPWRHTKDPYKIWVSEIMLQQTQVATVIPYYLDFLEAFPTVKHLAQASEHDLLQMWQGLGYYSRARNMQLAAQTICEEFGGVFPSNMKDLLSLKGNGPYTAAAIGSMAFDLVEPAIDGNLMRIVARLFELDVDIAQPKSRKVFEEILYQLIDPDRPGDFNQALMDIGATVMTPSNLYPENNPLTPFNASHKNHTAHLYPVKSKKTKSTTHQFNAYILMNTKGEYLIRKHTEQELLTGLWHFPMCEMELVSESSTSGEVVEPFENWLADVMGKQVQGQIQLQSGQIMPQKVKHVFSHRVWQVQPIFVKTSKKTEEMIAQFITEDKTSKLAWIAPQSVGTYPISTLQAKLFKQIGFEN